MRESNRSFWRKVLPNSWKDKLRPFEDKLCIVSLCLSFLVFPMGKATDRTRLLWKLNESVKENCLKLWLVHESMYYLHHSYQLLVHVFRKLSIAWYGLIYLVLFPPSKWRFHDNKVLIHVSIGFQNSVSNLVEAWGIFTAFRSIQRYDAQTAWISCKVFLLVLIVYCHIHICPFAVWKTCVWKTCHCCTWRSLYALLWWKKLPAELSPEGKPIFPRLFLLKLYQHAQLSS